MMGALQAPKIELMEFHGDPMLYHAFIRSFEENVEKMLLDDGARLARLMHLCKGEAGRAIRCLQSDGPGTRLRTSSTSAGTKGLATVTRLQSCGLRS